MRLVHLQTIVQTIYGELGDDDDNIGKRHPIQVEISKVTDGAFVEACGKIQKSKEELIKNNGQTNAV